jgi:hypothetical protein
LEEDSSIETDFLAVVLFLDHLWQDLDDWVEEWWFFAMDDNSLYNFL